MSMNYPSAWWNRHILFRNYLRFYPDKAKEYEYFKLMLAKQHDNTISYAAAKTEFCQQIESQAYFDFAVNRPDVSTTRLNGYIPQQACFDNYKEMFQDTDFVKCFGVKLDDEKIKNILLRDTQYWNQYRFGPYVWFDKLTQQFIGEGGLNHTEVEGQQEIELTYSLKKEFWGKGLAVEIGKFAIDMAFNKLNLEHIVCFTRVGNQQSLRVMEKLKFQYVRDFVHADLPHMLYRLSKKCYK